MENKITLLPGDEVFWNDPDEGICSGVYTIVSIIQEGDICVIRNSEGSVVECFLNELS